MSKFANQLISKRIEKKILTEAASLIENGEMEFCCLAIRRAVCNVVYGARRPADLTDDEWLGLRSIVEDLVARFGQTYGMYTQKSWFNDSKPKTQLTRTLLLLTFAEVG